MYGIYANIWGILMVNVTIYSVHGSYGICIYIYIDVYIYIYILYLRGKQLKREGWDMQVTAKRRWWKQSNALSSSKRWDARILDMLWNQSWLKIQGIKVERFACAKNWNLMILEFEKGINWREPYLICWQNQALNHYIELRFLGGGRKKKHLHHAEAYIGDSRSTLSRR